MPRKTEIQLRRDTAANWTSVNPVLGAGEFGYESDTGKAKIGDGATAWTGLSYFAGSGGGLNTIASSGGTITVTNGTGPNANVDLPTTGVSGGTYGDTSHVAQVTVDVEGRITAASSQAISVGAGAVTWGGYQQSIFGLWNDGTFHIVSATTSGAKLVRMLIDKTGTLDLVGVYIGSVSAGNVSLAVYDTGQTTSGTATRLATSGAVASPGTQRWFTFNPGISVNAGDQVLVGISADNNTVNTACALFNNALQCLPPSGFFSTPAAARIFASGIASGVHPLPSTIADATLLIGNVNPPTFIAHVS